jgi:hypothetical protein
MRIRRPQVLAGLVGGIVACAAFSASADTIGTLSIGEQSNGGVNPAGNLATYNFSTNDNNQNINLTTVLSATSDPAGEVTTALKGNTSNWFVTSGNIYAVVMEMGSPDSSTDRANLSNWSDLVRITSTGATLWSDPQDWSVILAGLSLTNSSPQFFRSETALFTNIPIGNSSGFTLAQNMNAVLKVYSDGPSVEIDLRPVPLSPIPLPAALPLLVGALSMLGLLSRRRRREDAAAA